MLSAPKIFEVLLSDFTPRQREVVSRRFGLGSDGEMHTLAALGDEYGVTRERIRQIEAGALQVLKRTIPGHRPSSEILTQGRKFIERQGGVAAQKDLMAHLAAMVEKLTPNHLSVLLAATGAFREHAGDADFHPFYFANDESFKKANDFINRFAKSLRAEKRAILGGDYATHLTRFVKETRFDPKIAANYLKITHRIHSNPYGDMGLAEWPEIKPKTIRDRIYLVLAKSSDPIHFEDITVGINKAGFGGRKALAPTVHNELIKDERFVLVGRGIYGLAERGYPVGTAKEVITNVLKKSGPLRFPELVLAVQKNRIFKPNTILANLQNKGLFERLGDGTYCVREA